MKPVYQDPSVGECVRCCFATIFEVPKDDLPFFGSDVPIEARVWHPDGYDAHPETGEAMSSIQFAEMHQWLGQFGLALHHIQPSWETGRKEETQEYRYREPWGLCIATGPASRGYEHAVVWNADEPRCRDEEHPLARGLWSGDMVHDPHPSGEGLLRVDEFWCFRVADPVLATRPLLPADGIEEVTFPACRAGRPDYSGPCSDSSCPVHHGGPR